MFRHGVRKGIKRGIEIGRQSVPPILNRCVQHNMPTYPRIVQVADGRWIEMWCCPMWAEHTMHDLAMPAVFPDVERQSDKLPATLAQAQPGVMLFDYLQKHHDAGPETRTHRTIRLGGNSPDNDRR